MLHEVLLALSGHPSPLFDEQQQHQKTHDQLHNGFPLLSPSEKALLHSIGQLAELHRKAREHVAHIATYHRSVICRAVATSIQHDHLPRFQRKILDVESRILTKDTSMVGAYDIVPLAGVVSEFDGWHRRMAWYWDIACHMQAPQHGSGTSKGLDRCTGAAIIDKLREEQRTGFTDVEDAAVELSRVAEMAWLRQLTSWLLYGTLPAYGADDFFIRAENEESEDSTQFLKRKDMLPKFVSSSTASSILFVGRSLCQVRRYAKRAPHSSPFSSLQESELASEHLQHLSSLSLPIVSAQLSRAVITIRHSLSKNVLQNLLPIEKTLNLLSCMKQFFLLSRGDFAPALINEVDRRLHARQQNMGRLLQKDPVKALQGLSIKDAEMQQILSQALKSLASNTLDDEDDVLEFTRSNITLGAPVANESRPTSSDSAYDLSPNVTPVVFHDLLFPNAAALSLRVPEPLELVVSSMDIQTYSSISSYLLAIERSYLRLSDLWKLTPARRERLDTSTLSVATKEQAMKRRIASRKIWATCSASIFLLSEIASYFEGEIINQSSDHFEQWIKAPTASEAQQELESPSAEVSHVSPQRDPESLANGHRIFLAALTYALLLTDVAFTRQLRSLLANVDSLVAFFTVLLDTQQKLDLERESGGETGHTRSEEQRNSLELDRARKKVDSDLKSVVNRLRQLDHERIGSGRYLDVGPSESGFQPWKGGGVDRLLMKLEFGRMAENAS